MNTTLHEGEDYILDDKGRMVLTRVYHLKRGYCCGNGCQECPYNLEQVTINQPKEKP